MASHFLDEQNYYLWVRLGQARDAIFAVRSKELSQYGITAKQAAVLFIVKLLEETATKSTPSELSRWLLKEPHSVSRILIRMESAGFVRRNSGLDKKNEVNVTLTEKGEQAYNQSLKMESIREIMSCLSEEERQQLSPLLEKIRDKALNIFFTNRSKLPFP